jgi:hypothetical protein
VFAFIKHAINLAKHTFRDVCTGSKRSPKWKGVEKAFLSLHGFCAVCGETDKKLLAVHHIFPFHIYPQLELDMSNLITLCIAKNKWHHLHVGHLGNFKYWNPNVGYDAAVLSVHPEQIDAVLTKSRADFDALPKS